MLTQALLALIIWSVIPAVLACLFFLAIGHFASKRPRYGRSRGVSELHLGRRIQNKDFTEVFEEAGDQAERMSNTFLQLVHDRQIENVDCQLVEVDTVTWDRRRTGHRKQHFLFSHSPSGASVTVSFGRMGRDLSAAGHLYLRPRWRFAKIAALTGLCALFLGWLIWLVIPVAVVIGYFKRNDGAFASTFRDTISRSEWDEIEAVHQAIQRSILQSADASGIFRKPLQGRHLAQDRLI